MGVSTARAQTERAGDADAIDQGLYGFMHLLKQPCLLVGN